MDYRVIEEPLRNRRQTSNEIKRLVKVYADDLHSIYTKKGFSTVPVSSLPFEDFFDFVKNLPYKRDQVPVESVGRPLWIMERVKQGMDCKKKSVLIASWLKLHHIPYRFVGSSRRSDRQIHHIFPQARFGSEWVNVDATYSNYRIGQQKTVTAREIL